MWQELESGVELRGNNGLRVTIMTVKLFSAASEQLTEEPYEYLSRGQFDISTCP